jgi:soluble lytic murein transglycosylase-like protein
MMPRVKWVLALLAPLVLLNLAVAFFGSSSVFPLSPFHLSAKWDALTAYAKHRPRCLFSGHDDIATAISTAEKKHRLPRGLLKAMIEVESHSQAHRISAAGAMGPAQLVPATARHLRVRDPYDPVQSIDGGARYLSRHLKKYGDVRLALAAYNAGPGSVRSSVPKNGETEYYVKKVMYAWTKPSLRAPRTAAEVTRAGSK